MISRVEAGQPNGHDFEQTPRTLKPMPVPLTPKPSTACGRGERREAAA